MSKHIQIDLIDELPEDISRPSAKKFQKWADVITPKRHEDLASALDSLPPKLIVAIKLVDLEESEALNRTYRDKKKPTNILSFPAMPDSATMPVAMIEDEKNPVPLGDIAICAALVKKEADEQSKPVKDHWAHLTVHGLLHLLGFDHIDDAEAEIMESVEIAILAALEIPNPYLANN